MAKPKKENEKGLQMYTVKTIPDQPITNSDRACGRSAMPHTSAPVSGIEAAKWLAVRESNGNRFAAVEVIADGRVIATYRQGAEI